MATGAFEGQDGKQAALRMSGARAESMHGTLEMIDQNWGSVEGYVKQECGLISDEIEALRKNLIVPSDKAASGTQGTTAVLEKRAVL